MFDINLLNWSSILRYSGEWNKKNPPSASYFSKFLRYALPNIPASNHLQCFVCIAISVSQVRTALFLAQLQTTATDFRTRDLRVFSFFFPPTESSVMNYVSDSKHWMLRVCCDFISVVKLYSFLPNSISKKFWFRYLKLS